MYLLGVKYLEVLPQLTQSKGTTVFLPIEASGVMGALGGIKELLARASSGSDAPTGALPLPRGSTPKSGDR